MRAAAFLFAAALAWPAAAADWMRVEMTFQVQPGTAPAVAGIFRERLADQDGEVGIETEGDTVQVVAVLPAGRETNSLVARLATPGHLGLHRVLDAASDCSAPPPDVLCLPQIRAGDPVLYLAAAELDNAAIKDADPGVGVGDDRPVVNIRLTAEGAERFGRMTSESVGRKIAIAVDGRVLTAPVVRTPILGGSLMIDGNFTQADAAALARRLRSPPLPGPVELLSLNQDKADPPGWGARLRKLFD